jgi:hypothetical protein
MDDKFMLAVKTALDLAFEAGKWEGQVELEEHYDREQYSQSILESFYSKKTTTPLHGESKGRQVIINLRSHEWRNGVRKSTKEYLEKAFVVVRDNYIS